jgi:hypothetical protein
MGRSRGSGEGHVESRECLIEEKILCSWLAGIIRGAGGHVGKQGWSYGKEQEWVGGIRGDHIKERGALGVLKRRGR